MLFVNSEGLAQAFTASTLADQAISDLHDLLTDGCMDLTRACRKAEAAMHCS